MENFILTVNSTTTPLGAGGTFTGVWQEVEQWNSIMVFVKASHTGTLYVDSSIDGITTDLTQTFDVAAASAEFHRITSKTKFVRTRFVNDATPQTYLRLQCIAGLQNIVSVPANTQFSRDGDSIFTRNLPSFLEVATNKFQGIAKNNKSGINSDVDTATVPEFVWDGPTGNYTGFPTGAAEAIRIVSSDVNDTAAGTGARTVQVTGLDANFLIQSETLTLNGTTPVVSVNTFTRVHTAQVLTSGSSNQAFNVGTLTISHNVTTANVFLTIQPGRNQSNAAVYTVPAGKVGVMINLKVEIDRGTTGSIAGFMWTREFGASPRYRRPFTASNSSVFREDPYGGIVFGAKADIGAVVTSCSANNTAVYAAFDMVLIDDD